MYGRAVVLEVLVHGDDVGVVERAGEPRLAQEAMGELGRPGVEGAELLQRDLAVEVGLHRDVHDGHAAAPDLAQDLVAADDASRRRGAWLVRHLSSVRRGGVDRPAVPRMRPCCALRQRSGCRSATPALAGRSAIPAPTDRPTCGAAA